jgi:heme-degrading monooxygenase HmoA
LSLGLEVACPMGFQCFGCVKSNQCEVTVSCAADKFTIFCNMFEFAATNFKMVSMIKRIVMMALLPGQEGLFLDIFEKVKEEIRGQNGCRGLEVLKSEQDGRLSVWTISLWDSITALEGYRSSELFKKTWSAVKPLFADKARAWTLTSIETVQ